MTHAYQKLLNETCQWIQETYEETPFFYSTKNHDTERKKETLKKQASFAFPQKLQGTEVLLINLEPKPSETALLERLSKAIDERIAPAHYLELKGISKDYLNALKEACPKVRWILLSEPKLYLSCDLVSFFQAHPKHTLMGASLFLLADLSAYERDLSLKKNLWSTLLQKL